MRLLGPQGVSQVQLRAHGFNRLGHLALQLAKTGMRLCVGEVQDFAHLRSGFATSTGVRKR
jgi:hypothetical protein